MSDWRSEYTRLIQGLNSEQVEAVRDLCDGYGKPLPPLGLFATAGSGKTRTVVALVSRLINENIGKPEDIVVTTFTRKAAGELKSRLRVVLRPGVLPSEEEEAAGQRSTLRVGTFHSLAAKAVFRSRMTKPQHQWEGTLNLDMPLGGRRGEVPKGVPQASARWVTAEELWNAIVLHGKIPGLPSDYPSLMQQFGKVGEARAYAQAVEIARCHGYLEPKDVPEDYLDEVSLKGWEMFNAARSALWAWDYADLLQAYWEVAKAGQAPAKLFVVDEGQDDSPIQMEIAQFSARSGRGRAVFVGDARQCIPEGQLIATPRGHIAVEDLRPGVEVYSSFGGTLAPAQITRVSQTMKSEAFEYTTETGSVFRATAEHVLFAALGKPAGYYVYLMWRKGYGYRVGASQATGDMGLKSIIVRTQQEGGERLWVLHCVDTAAEAHLLEHTVAYRYQVPMAPFKPREGTMFVDDASAAAFFNEFQSNGERVLAEYQQNFERPAYVAKSSSRGRVAVNVNIATSKGYSEVAVESQNVPEAVKAQFGFAASKNDCWRIRKYPRFATDAVALGESIVAAMPEDAYLVEVLSLRDTDRRVFGVCAAGVFPGMYVPEADAQGEVHLRLIVARRVVPVSRCFDLQIDASVNFVVGNVVVHNSIYAFRGAEPQIMISAKAKLGATELFLVRNYRSGRRIVEAGNLLCRRSDGSAEPWAVGPEAVPARDVDGRIELWSDDTPMARANRIADDLSERKLAGEIPQWKDAAVLARTRAAGGYLEVAFMRAKVPARIQAGGSFFAAKPVAVMLAHIRAALGIGKATLPADFRKLLRCGTRYPYLSKKLQGELWDKFATAVQTGELPRAWSRFTVSETNGRRGDKMLVWGRSAEQYGQDTESVDACLQIVSAGRGQPPMEVVERLARELAKELVLDVPSFRTQAEQANVSRREDEDDNEVSGEGDNDADMVTALIDIAQHFESLEALAEFSLLGNLGAAQAAEEGAGNKGEADASREALKDAVGVGTVHSAKGSEFHTVYLLCGGDQMPHRGEYNEEEKRLFYVAVTRAVDRLVLATTGASGRYVDQIRPVTVAIDEGQAEPVEVDSDEEEPDEDIPPDAVGVAQVAEVGGPTLGEDHNEDLSMPATPIRDAVVDTDPAVSGFEALRAYAVNNVPDPESFIAALDKYRADILVEIRKVHAERAAHAPVVATELPQVLDIERAEAVEAPAAPEGAPIATREPGGLPRAIVTDLSALAHASSISVACGGFGTGFLTKVPQAILPRGAVVLAQQGNEFTVWRVESDGLLLLGRGIMPTAAHEISALRDAAVRTYNDELTLTLPNCAVLLWTMTAGQPFAANGKVTMTANGAPYDFVYSPRDGQRFTLDEMISRGLLVDDGPVPVVKGARGDAPTRRYHWAGLGAPGPQERAPVEAVGAPVESDATEVSGTEVSGTEVPGASHHVEGGTVYHNSEMMGNIVAHEIRSGDFEIKPYAQYPRALEVRIIPKGARKPRGLWRMPDQFFAYVPPGLAAPVPPPMYGERTPNAAGTVTTAHGRYSGFDSRWVSEFEPMLPVGAYVWKDGQYMQITSAGGGNDGGGNDGDFEPLDAEAPLRSGALPAGFDDFDAAPAAPLTREDQERRALEAYVDGMPAGTQLDYTEFGAAPKRTLVLTDRPPAPTTWDPKWHVSGLRRLANIAPKVRAGDKLHSWVVIVFRSGVSAVAPDGTVTPTVRFNAYVPDDASGAISEGSLVVVSGAPGAVPPKVEKPTAPPREDGLSQDAAEGLAKIRKGANPGTMKALLAAFAALNVQMAANADRKVATLTFPDGEEITLTQPANYRGGLSPEALAGLGRPYIREEDWERAKTLGYWMRDDAARLLGLEPIKRDDDGRPVRDRNVATDFTIRTCPVCFRDIKATNGVMADHGFTIHGRNSMHQGGERSRGCYGVDKQPYEVSAETTKRVVAGLEQEAEGLRIRLDKLKAGEIKELHVRDHTKRAERGKPEPTKIVTPADGWAWTDALKGVIANVEYKLGKLWSGSYGSVPWFRMAVRVWKPWPADKPARGAPGEPITDADRARGPLPLSKFLANLVATKGAFGSREALSPVLYEMVRKIAFDTDHPYNSAAATLFDSAAGFDSLLSAVMADLPPAPTAPPTSNKYVTVAWAEPGRPYREENWKERDLPALYEQLRAKGVRSVTLDDTTEVPLAAPTSAELVLGGSPPTEHDLQRRVQPFGWDVTTFGPDLAVPQIGFTRRDGTVQVTVQKAGLGWSIEVGYPRKVVRRNGRGPSYDATELDSEILRFNGSTQLPTIETALALVGQILVENGPKLLGSETPKSLSEGHSEAEFDAKALARGTAQEMREHGLDEPTARRIAMDHLVEDPDAYATEADAPKALWIRPVGLDPSIAEVPKPLPRPSDIKAANWEKAVGIVGSGIFNFHAGRLIRIQDDSRRYAVFAVYPSWTHGVAGTVAMDVADLANPDAVKSAVRRLRELLAETQLNDEGGLTVAYGTAQSVYKAAKGLDVGWKIATSWRALPQANETESTGLKPTVPEGWNVRSSHHLFDADDGAGNKARISFVPGAGGGIYEALVKVEGGNAEKQTFSAGLLPDSNLAARRSAVAYVDAFMARVERGGIATLMDEVTKTVIERLETEHALDVKWVRENASTNRKQAADVLRGAVSKILGGIVLENLKTDPLVAQQADKLQGAVAIYTPVVIEELTQTWETWSAAERAMRRKGWTVVHKWGDPMTPERVDLGKDDGTHATLVYDEAAQFYKLETSAKPAPANPAEPKAERDPAYMTNGEINKEREKLNALSSAITQEFIAAGRGHERPSDTRGKTDPLSMRSHAVSDRLQALQLEGELRYGPRFLGVLPKGGARQTPPESEPPNKFDTHESKSDIVATLKAAVDKATTRVEIEAVRKRIRENLGGAVSLRQFNAWEHTLDAKLKIAAAPKAPPAGRISAAEQAVETLKIRLGALYAGWDLAVWRRAIMGHEYVEVRFFRLRDGQQPLNGIKENEPGMRISISARDDRASQWKVGEDPVGQVSADMVNFFGTKAQWRTTPPTFRKVTPRAMGLEGLGQAVAKVAEWFETNKPLLTGETA